MKPFPKRHYTSFRQFTADFAFSLAHRTQIRAIIRGTALDPAFRERIMMAVTSVNQCRFCSYVHTRAALKEGVTAAELDALARHDLPEAPTDQRTALIFAQHWVDTRGTPLPTPSTDSALPTPPKQPKSSLSPCDSSTCATSSETRSTAHCTTSLLARFPVPDTPRAANLT